MTTLLNYQMSDVYPGPWNNSGTHFDNFLGRMEFGLYPIILGYTISIFLYFPQHLNAKSILPIFARSQTYSKTQFRQPAIPRVIASREPPGGEGGVGGGRRRQQG